MSKCDLNTCSERLPSMCVLYTGDLIDNSYITLPDCNPTLNDFLSQVDQIIKSIKDNENILVSDVRSANCGFSKIDDLLNTLTNLDGPKVKSSQTILTLLKIICDQQTELNDLKNGGIYDLPLSSSILSNLGCLSGIINDQCNGPIKINTLGDLLIQIIKKICT